MSYWDNNPKIFKILISFVLLVFLAVIAINFRQNIYPTDENRYTDLQQKIISKNEILLPNIDDKDRTKLDTLEPQTVFFKIDDKEINSTASMRRILDTLKKDKYELITVPLHHPKLDTHYVEKDFLPDSTNFYLIEAGARIIWVMPGGASDRAGLKQGDVIIAVNGERFNNIFEADSMMRNNHRGQIIEYTVLTEGHFKKIDVKLAKYGVKISYLSMIVSGLFSLGLGWFLAFFRPKIIGARITGFALMVAGFLFGSFVNTGYGFITFQIIKTIMILTGAAFVVPIFMHSNYFFPKYNDVLNKRRWIVIVAYLIGSVGITVMNLAVFRFNSFLNSNVVTSVIFFVLVAYAITIHFVYYKKIDPEINRMNRYIDFATFLLFVIGLLNVLANFNGWYQVNEYIFIGLLFFPLSYLYTIGRYRLFNIDLRIRRNIQYVVFSGLWKLVLGLVGVFVISYLLNIQINLPNLHFTGTSVEILERPLKEPLREYYEKVIFLILAFIVLYFVYKIGNAGVDYLNKKFNRTKLDFQKAYSHLMNTLENSIKIDEISQKLSSNIAEIFQLKQVGFIVFDNSKKVLVQNYYGLNEDKIKEFIELISDRLYQSATEYDGIFSTDYLQENIREVFDDCRFSHIASVKTKGRISGLLLIGEKLSETSFTAEELDHINSIASQTAVSLENAFLYEDLAQQERMKHELEIARKIQLASLPQNIPNIKGLDISGISIPAFEVGGDFYDYLNGSTEDITIVVGDVSGKGTSAALYQSKAQGIMRTLYEFDLEPAELFKRTNNQLYKNIDRSAFISAIAVRFLSDKKEFKLSRAGHLPMYWYSHSNQEVSKVMPQGIALGISNNLMFDKTIDQITHKYNPMDVMVFITDGVIEARDRSGNEYGEFRLIRLIKENSNMQAKEIREKIINDITEFSQQKEQFDDLTVVVIKAS